MAVDVAGGWPWPGWPWPPGWVVVAVAGWPWPGGRVAVAGWPWPGGRGRVAVAGPWPWPGRGRGRSGRQLKKAIVQIVRTTTGASVKFHNQETRACVQVTPVIAKGHLQATRQPRTIFVTKNALPQQL